MLIGPAEMRGGGNEEGIIQSLSRVHGPVGGEEGEGAWRSGSSVATASHPCSHRRQRRIGARNAEEELRDRSQRRVDRHRSDHAASGDPI
jgi:hypothetical protein